MSDNFDVDALIEERSSTHGDYMLNSEITWSIKDALHRGTRYNEMHPAMKETLDMVAHKMHRIVNGDPFFKDHWVDMTGYPHLVVGRWDDLLAWRDGRTPPHSQLRLTPEEIDTILALRSGKLSPAQETMKRDMLGGADVLPNGTTADILWCGDVIQVEIVGWVERNGTVWYKLKDDAGNDYSRPRDGMTLRPAPAPVLQAAGEPSEGSPEPAEGAAGTTLAADAPEAPTVLPFSHEVRREPTLLTNFEHLSLDKQTIRHGSLEGVYWQVIFTQREDGRWAMGDQYVEEYGK